MSISSTFENNDNLIVHIRFDNKIVNTQYLIAIHNFIIQYFNIKGIETFDKVYTEEQIYFDFDEKGNIIKKKEYIIFSQSNKIEELKYFKYIDHKRTFTNDLYKMFIMYGIETTNLMTLRETLKVYHESGFAINYQHAKLMVDIMSLTGKMISFNSFGFTKLDNEPLAKASFEKVVNNLVESAIFNEKDSLQNVSARIITGLPFKGGTGLPELIFNTDMLLNHENKKISENNNRNMLNLYTIANTFISNSNFNDIYIPSM